MKATVKTVKSKKHPNGTYAEVLPDEETSKVLFDFIKQHNIPNSVKDFHCTVVYSRKPAPSYEAYDLKLPVVAKITELKLFDTNEGEKALVACLDTPELNRAHYDSVEHHGATYDYQMYVPHITLSYNFTGKTLPKNLPVCDPKFVKFVVKPLKGVKS